MNSGSPNLDSKHPFPFSMIVTNALFFLAFACFTLSLFMIVFFTNEDNFYGFFVLLTGWMGAIFIQLGWFANPLNLLALLNVRERPKVALFLSLFAFFFACSAFSFHEIPTDINQKKVFIREFGLGFYFWFLAQALFLVATFVRCMSTYKRN